MENHGDYMIGELIGQSYPGLSMTSPINNLHYLFPARRSNSDGSSVYDSNDDYLDVNNDTVEEDDVFLNNYNNDVDIDCHERFASLELSFQSTAGDSSSDYTDSSSDYTDDGFLNEGNELRESFHAIHVTEDSRTTHLHNVLDSLIFPTDMYSDEGDSSEDSIDN